MPNFDQEFTELVDYYANLLIYQYISQPKAYATTFADVAPILMPQMYGAALTDQNLNPLTDDQGTALYASVNSGPAIFGDILPLALQDAFTLGSAVGVQLDTLAKYIGGVRTNFLLNGTLYTMSDAQFTQYLTTIGARNSLASDMGSIIEFLQTYFFNQFTVYDYEDMRMGFTFFSAPGTNPGAEAFITAGYLPVPMAVGYTLAYNPTGNNFFAFRTYNSVSQPTTTGYNFYSGSIVGKFLSYSNVI